MKALYCFLLLLLIPIFHLRAQELINPPVKHSIPFVSGEKFTYQIRYGFIVGGTTTLSLTEEIYKNKKVFHATAIGQTTGVANTIYGVKDVYESWFDKETILPFKQLRNIKEGHYTIINEVTYNRRNNTVHSNLTGDHKVPEKILDICSAFYFIRRVDFTKIAEGDEILVNTFFGDEIFPFHLRYLGKETIRTKIGKLNCLKISPIVQVGRMFNSEDDMTIWFSDDEKCLPVQVKMDIRIVGAVFLKLVDYENPADSLTTNLSNM